MKKPAACEGCALYAAPGPIRSQGDYTNAKIIVITDAPSAQDSQAQLPFSDGVGRVFNHILYESGLRRSEVFITSVVRCYGNQRDTESAAATCSKFLERDLDRCKSDTVLLLGDTAFKRFIGSYSTLHTDYHPPSDVYTRRGCVEQRSGRKWIGTLHPRDHMRNVQIKDECINHYTKAALIANAPLPLPQVHESVSDADVVRGVELIRTKIGGFANDVETYQPKDVAEDDYVGGNYAVDMGGISLGEWAAMVCSPSQFPLLAPLFRDPTLWRFEHNGPYDQYHFAKLLGSTTLYRDYTINPHNKWIDGMLAAHYAGSHKFKYLKPDCLSRYTRLPYYDRKLEAISRRLYNGMDVLATHQECVHLRKRGESEGWWKSFLEIGMELLPVLEEQRVLGVRCDVRKVLLFRRIFEAKLEKVKELAEKLTPGLSPFNPHHQKKLFYEVWKLPEQKNKDTKKATTDYDARKRLREWIEAKPERREKHSAARNLIDLIDYHTGEKKKLEYLDRISPDGRIHAFYKAHGTQFFRPASTPNLQNFPVHDISDWGGGKRVTKSEADPLGAERREYGSLRSLVLPDHPDDLILTIDFNQIQLWIYAAISGSQWLKAMYDSGDYIYGSAYEQLNKLPFFKAGLPRTKTNMRPDVPEQMLRNAKAAVLGYLFGRSAEAVASEYNIPVSDGYKSRKWWFDNNPELLRSYAATEYEVKQKGYVRQEDGVRIYFPDGKLTEAINCRAQYWESHIVNGSVVAINRAFKERGWTNTRIMLSVHDSITMNIHNAKNNPAHLIDVYESIVLPVCTRPIEYLKGWSFRIEATVAESWDWKAIKYSAWKESFAIQRELQRASTSCD